MLYPPKQPDAVPIRARVRFWQKRWFKILLVLFLICSVALGIGIYKVTRPENLARLASKPLSEITNTDISISSAYAELDGTIHLVGVSLRVPDQPGFTGRFIDAKEVVIKQDLSTLWKRKFSAKHITFTEPTIFITEDPALEKYNYQLLQEVIKKRKTATTQPWNPPKELPEIFIKGGSVCFGEVVDAQYAELGRLHVDGFLNADAQMHGLYDFKLSQLSEGSSGAVVSGKLDLNKLSVVGKLDKFSISNPQRMALPRRLQEWWDRLEPAGSLPTVSFGYDDTGLGFYAVLELKDGEITLPYGDTNANMKSRMTHVNGRFNVTFSSIQVQNLTGQIEGLDYKLDGQINGFDAEAPFKLVVEIKQFELPQKPRYLPALPRSIQNQFYRFTPSGNFRALVLLERKDREGKISYDGTVNLSNVNASFSKFPYPISDLRGELRFNDERVEIVSMKGKGPTGANITVSGIVAPPREGASLDVRVTGSDVPVDEYLRAAISPEQASIIDVLQDRPTYEALLAKGLVQSTVQKKQRAAQLVDARERLEKLQTEAKAQATQPAPEARAALEAQIVALEAQVAKPVFDLACKASFVAEVKRPLGPDSKYNTTVFIEAAGTDVLIKQWPYPVKLTKGRVTVAGGNVTVDDIEARGLTGAVGSVNGIIEPGVGRARSPKLQIIIKSMPLDALILNTVPEPHDHWLRELQLTGQLDAIGVLVRSPDAPPNSPIEFRFETELSKGRSQPHGGAYVIDDVSGKVIIERGKVTLESIRGKHGSTALALTGVTGTRVETVAQSVGTAPVPRTSFTLKATDLQFKDPIADLLPPTESLSEKIREIMNRHKPTGSADAEVVIEAEGKTTALKCRLEPKTLAFDFENRRIELTHCKGPVLFEKGVAKFDHWKTELGTGSYDLHGEIDFADKPRVNMVVNARNQMVCQQTRAALPAGLVKFIDGLKLDGSVELKNAKVTYNLPDKPGLYVKGVARLQDVTGMVGFKIRDLAGEIDFDVAMASPKDKMPRLDLKVDLQKFIASDRLVGPLSMLVVSGETNSELVVKDISGEFYRGSIAGSGKVDVSEGGSWQVRLSVSDSDVGPIVYPLRYAEAKGEPKSDPNSDNGNFEALRKAKISASLDLKGLVATPEKRSGRGRFDVTNVSLNQSPLATAIIQIVNLTLPTGEGLNHALATFIINDDDIQFERVQLDSPSFSFVGKGHMAYKAQTLNLDFLAQARRKELVPLVAVWRLLLDQLINIHVSGTLSKPVAELRPLEGVRQGVDELIGKPARGPSKTSPEPPPVEPSKE